MLLPRPLIRKASVPEEAVTRVTHAGDTVIVSLSGEVDVLTVDRVRVALSEALAARPRRVEVDLAELSFIDVRGVEELVELARQVAPAGRVKVISPPVAMRRILEVAGWEPELDLVEDLERERK